MHYNVLHGTNMHTTCSIAGSRSQVLLQEHIVYQAQPAWHVRQAQHAAGLAQPLALRLLVAQALALALPPLYLRALSASPGVGVPSFCHTVDLCTLLQCIASNCRASAYDRHAWSRGFAASAWHIHTDLTNCTAATFLLQQMFCRLKHCLKYSVFTSVQMGRKQIQYGKLASM